MDTSLYPDQPTLSGAKVMITGGAGFIGSSLAATLIEKNKVVILDNFHRNALEGKGVKLDLMTRQDGANSEAAYQQAIDTIRAADETGAAPLAFLKARSVAFVLESRLR